MNRLVTIAVVCLAGSVDATKLHATNKALLESEMKEAIKALEAVEDRVGMMEKNGELEKLRKMNWDFGGQFNNAFNKFRTGMTKLFG